MGLYEVPLTFTVDATLPPVRNVLHAALERVRAITVQAATVEEAELWVDQIRLALEDAADNPR